MHPSSSDWWRSIQSSCFGAPSATKRIRTPRGERRRAVASSSSEPSWNPRLGPNASSIRTPVEAASAAAARSATPGPPPNSPTGRSSRAAPSHTALGRYRPVTLSFRGEPARREPYTTPMPSGTRRRARINASRNSESRTDLTT